MRGFSLIEAVITIAVIAVVATAIVVSWVGYQRSQALETATRDLQTILREAQGNAIGRVENANWGVNIVNPAGSASPVYAELFFNASGTSYTGGTVVRRATLSSSVEFTVPMDGGDISVAFAERTGTRVDTAGAHISSYAPADTDGTCNDSSATECSLRITFNAGSGGTCGDSGSSDWWCTSVDSVAGNVGRYTSIAFDPAGAQWISYLEPTNGALKVARHVKSGGTGCSRQEWTCSTIATAVGSTSANARRTSLGFDASGGAWIAFDDLALGKLRIADYVGSGGNCGDGAWNCAVVGDLYLGGGDAFVSLAFDLAGTPWIAYYSRVSGGACDGSPSDECALKVARYVGSGGTGCGTGGSAAWSCSAVDASGTADRGLYPSIGFDRGGTPWVAYYEDVTADFRVARWVGSGGNCTDTAWQCDRVEGDGSGAAEAGKWTAIAFDAAGNPWITYDNDAGLSCSTGSCLRVAQYVGFGGNCGSGIWADAFDCTIVDDTGHTGNFTSIVFDASDSPLVSYYRFSPDPSALRLAHRVGSGGTGCGVGSPVWKCTTIDAQTNQRRGQYTSVAMSPFFNLRFHWVGESNSTDRWIRIGSQGGILIE